CSSRRRVTRSNEAATRSTTAVTSRGGERRRSATEPTPMRHRDASRASMPPTEPRSDHPPAPRNGAAGHFPWHRNSEAEEAIRTRHCVRLRLEVDGTPHPDPDGCQGSPFPTGPGDDVAAGRRAELAVQRGDLVADGRRAEVEADGDRDDGEPVGEALENVLLEQILECCRGRTYGRTRRPSAARPARSRIFPTGPLPDSNRRPLPYQRSSSAPAVTRR